MLVAPMVMPARVVTDHHASHSNAQVTRPGTAITPTSHRLQLLAHQACPAAQTPARCRPVCVLSARRCLRMRSLAAGNPQRRASGARHRSPTHTRAGCAPLSAHKMYHFNFSALRSPHERLCTFAQHERIYSGAPASEQSCPALQERIAQACVRNATPCKRTDAVEPFFIVGRTP
jgi:hypothetical protein